jgi:LysR family transcriptional regulator, hydrogen peroxide-inducible genes activator
LWGELDLAVMAQPEPFNERLDVLPLYSERCCIAFPTGIGSNSKIAWRLPMSLAKPTQGASNCEYHDYLRPAAGARARGAGRVSERCEDWIQMMVVAGFGVCFLPEFSPTIPGVRTQSVTGPEITRQVSLVSMSGQRFSPAVMTFIRAIRPHDWSGSGAAEAG